MTCGMTCSTWTPNRCELSLFRQEMQFGLSFDDRGRVANFVNAYPNLEISYQMAVNDEVYAGDAINLTVSISRDADDDSVPEQIADAALFPRKKTVNWWLVIGDPASRKLYGIKKTAIKHEMDIKIQFSLPAGQHQLKLYCICDSYNGQFALLGRISH